MSVESPQPKRTWLSNFIQVYQSLGTDNLASLKSIYHPNVAFADPLHKISGFDQLLNYFDHLYSNLTECSFVVTDVIESDDEAAIYWNMTYCHKQLNKSKAIYVEGHSRLKMRDDLVIFHRDYLDVGEMLYENIPLLGPLVKAVKRRAAN